MHVATPSPQHYRPAAYARAVLLEAWRTSSYHVGELNGTSPYSDHRKRHSLTFTVLLKSTLIPFVRRTRTLAAEWYDELLADHRARRTNCVLVLIGFSRAALDRPRFAGVERNFNERDREWNEELTSANEKATIASTEHSSAMEHNDRRVMQSTDSWADGKRRTGHTARIGGKQKPKGIIVLRSG